MKHYLEASQKMYKGYMQFLEAQTQEEKELAKDLIRQAMHLGINPQIQITATPFMGAFEVLFDAKMEPELAMLLDDKNWNPNYQSRNALQSTPLQDCMQAGRVDLMEKIIDHPRFNPNFSGWNSMGISEMILKNAKGNQTVEMIDLFQKVTHHPLFQVELAEKRVKPLSLFERHDGFMPWGRSQERE